MTAKKERRVPENVSGLLRAISSIQDQNKQIQLYCTFYSVHIHQDLIASQHSDKILEIFGENFALLSAWSTAQSYGTSKENYKILFTTALYLLSMKQDPAIANLVISMQTRISSIPIVARPLLSLNSSTHKYLFSTCTTPIEKLSLGIRIIEIFGHSDIGPRIPITYLAELDITPDLSIAEFIQAYQTAVCRNGLEPETAWEKLEIQKLYAVLRRRYLQIPTEEENQELNSKLLNNIDQMLQSNLGYDCFLNMMKDQKDVQLLDFIRNNFKGLHQSTQEFLFQNYKQWSIDLIPVYRHSKPTKACVLFVGFLMTQRKRGRMINPLQLLEKLLGITGWRTRRKITRFNILKPQYQAALDHESIEELIMSFFDDTVKIDPDFCKALSFSDYAALEVASAQMGSRHLPLMIDYTIHKPDNFMKQEIAKLYDPWIPLINRMGTSLLVPYLYPPYVLREDYVMVFFNLLVKSSMNMSAELKRIFREVYDKSPPAQKEESNKSKAYKMVGAFLAQTSQTYNPNPNFYGTYDTLDKQLSAISYALHCSVILYHSPDPSLISCPYYDSIAAKMTGSCELLLHSLLTEDPQKFKSSLLKAKTLCDIRVDFNKNC